MSINFEDFTRAWNDDKTLVYPANPKADGERWFLRTRPSSVGRSAAIIGINPSTAVKLGLRREGYDGDQTTDKLLKRFHKADLERSTLQQNEPIFDDLVIVNLIPHVASNSNLFSGWNPCNDNLQIMESITTTKQLWNIVVDSVSDVILIWGNPNDKDYPWKPYVLKSLEPYLKSLTTNKNIWAVASTEDPHYPYHPRYPKWTNLPLTQV